MYARTRSSLRYERVLEYSEYSTVQANADQKTVKFLTPSFSRKV